MGFHIYMTSLCLIFKKTKKAFQKQREGKDKDVWKERDPRFSGDF